MLGAVLLCSRSPDLWPQWPLWHCENNNTGGENASGTCWKALERVHRASCSRERWTQNTTPSLDSPTPQAAAMNPAQAVERSATRVWFLASCSSCRRIRPCQAEVLMCSQQRGRVVAEQAPHLLTTLQLYRAVLLSLRSPTKSRAGRGPESRERKTIRFQSNSQHASSVKLREPS